MARPSVWAEPHDLPLGSPRESTSLRAGDDAKGASDPPPYTAETVGEDAEDDEPAVNGHQHGAGPLLDGGGRGLEPVYEEADVERIGSIRSAHRLGFTFDEIRETLALRDRDKRPCGYVFDVLDRRVDEFAARIAEMRTLHTTLQELRSRARDLNEVDGARNCQVIEHKQI